MSGTDAFAEPRLAPGLSHRPKVGVVHAFTGRYESVEILARFLHSAGFDVVTSRVSTPPIIEAGTALASADFCFPLRVYVGHIYTMCQHHPDLAAIVAPNVWTDHAGSATCSKYRDAGGVAIRSLGGMLPYLEAEASRRGAGPAAAYGKGAVAAGQPCPGTGQPRLGAGQPLPRMIRPDLESPSFAALRNVAYDIYAQVLGLPKWSAVGFLLPPRLRRRWARHIDHVEAAFAQAWREVSDHPAKPGKALLADESRPRLAVVGRRYLIHDPLLTADLKPWFQRRGAVVLTAEDVPWAELEPSYRQAKGYYDTHLEGQAFIDWAADKVDGFIALGSFGCHPDAFQVDYLAEYARAKAKPAWTFRFDENAGTAGFQTRFETIYGFLEQGRDRRVQGAAARPEASDPGAPAPVVPARTAATPASGAEAPARRPLFTWPYMGEELNAALEELFFQLGLQEFTFPPRPIDGSTLEVGSRRYAETCSPYACATGSLMQNIRRLLQDFRAEAEKRGEVPEPRRVIVLMVQGEGPCTFGWYAIAQNHHLPTDLAGDLSGGHTLELLTAGFSNPVELFRELACLGNGQRLGPVVRFLETLSTNSWRSLSLTAKVRLLAGLASSGRLIMGAAWAKLTALERVRAKSLLVRAHEMEPGQTTAVYRECLNLMRDAHGLGAIRRVRRQCEAKLATVPQDSLPKPRVAAVGEIYVALTSFANRGVIEKLLGQAGIEVVEGVTTTGFVRRSVWEAGRRAVAGHHLIGPVRLWLERRHVTMLRQRPYDLGARPLLEHEVGGEGMPNVAFALRQVQRGVAGIIHVYPFKCMPESIAKDAFKEMSDLYGVRYLGLSFDKEQEIERVKTEVATFAALLHAQLEDRRGWTAMLRLMRQRRAVSRRLRRAARSARTIRQ